jgi:hypothetical protein
MMTNKEKENTFLEIGTALAGGALTLFIGTGFSKYLTDNKTPSWSSLLSKCARQLDKKLVKKLFQLDKQGRVTGCKYDFTICAQILEDAYKREGKDIRQTISLIVKSACKKENINFSKLKKLKSFFDAYPRFNVITTNYDELIRYLVPNSKEYTEGSRIPKTTDVKPIYHIHGSISNPKSIILTQDDYFKFQHKENYISRKLFTLLQETTTVIIGYSLQDFNLNRILNESKYTKSEARKSDIYYVSYKKVDDLSRRYYFSTFGIKVLDAIEIGGFFHDLDLEMSEAEKIIKGAKRIPDILKGVKQFSDDFLKLAKSFTYILRRIEAVGYNIDDLKVLELLIEVLERKKEYTLEYGAWSQYAHLAEWLIEVGSLVDIASTQCASRYKVLLVYSFSTMSASQTCGQSWAAYDIWKNEVHRLTRKNKTMIKNIIQKQFPYVSAGKLLPLLETN